MQLIAGHFPLYRFAGDVAPGDVNGQGAHGAWFVVDTRARPIPRRRRLAR
jgi:predicted lipoprotein with Yx(FWY)xxD motif